MIKIKESIVRQEFMDLFKRYVQRGDATSRSFMNAMYLQLQYGLTAEYILRHSIVDGYVYAPFDGKAISRSYIQDFRHSWPFKSGGELYSKLS